MKGSPFPKKIYLSAPVRTPIGKFGGSLLHLTAPDLATLALEECKKRSGKTSADYVFLGHARQAGARPNPARQATIRAGLGESVPAMTVNQACASGVAAITAAIEKIAIGKSENCYAGGVESMSNTPYLLMDARWGQRLGHSIAKDGMTQDGFHCPMADMLMGKTVEEFIAKERKISRKEQDEYALGSQKKAGDAWKSGAFADETFEIAPQGKKPGLSTDEHMRPDTSLEKLGKLPPVFDPKNGTVSAGNSSGITDGAAFVHVGSDKTNAMVEVIDYETTALDPKYMGLGPVDAIRNLLKRQSLDIKDLEAIEINEAFAAQVLACQKELSIPDEKLNPRGGSIAIGHPIGATGARIVVTLSHILAGKSGALGIASLCVSGGQGAAILLRAL